MYYNVLMSVVCQLHHKWHLHRDLGGKARSCQLWVKTVTWSRSALKASRSILLVSSSSFLREYILIRLSRYNWHLPRVHLKRFIEFLDFFHSLVELNKTFPDTDEHETNLLPKAAWSRKTVNATFEPSNSQPSNSPSTSSINQLQSTNLTARSLLSPSESGFDTKSAKSPSREGRTTCDWCEARSYMKCPIFSIF